MKNYRYQFFMFSVHIMNITRDIRRTVKEMLVNLVVESLFVAFILTAS